MALDRTILFVAMLSIRILYFKKTTSLVAEDNEGDLSPRVGRTQRECCSSEDEANVECVECQYTKSIMRT